ncbi:hypothetical protein [Anaplasma phagocytophilum]|uniref:hypothetical protein n=1 Tax=Anaplasma phagocytophilum TaxID=948 RepID=UPI00201B1DB6
MHNLVLTVNSIVIGEDMVKVFPLVFLALLDVLNNRLLELGLYSGMHFLKDFFMHLEYKTYFLIIVG